MDFIFFSNFTFIIHRGFSKWYLLGGALSQFNIEFSWKCHDNSFEFDFSSSDIFSSSNGKTSLILTGFAKVSNPQHKPIDIKIVKIYAFKRLPETYLIFLRRTHQLNIFIGLSYYCNNNHYYFYCCVTSGIQWFWKLRKWFINSIHTHITTYSIEVPFSFFWIIIIT